MLHLNKQLRQRIVEIKCKLERVFPAIPWYNVNFSSNDNSGSSQDESKIIIPDNVGAGVTRAEEISLQDSDLNQLQKERNNALPHKEKSLIKRSVLNVEELVYDVIKYPDPAGYGNPVVSESTCQVHKEAKLVLGCNVPIPPCPEDTVKRGPVSNETGYGSTSMGTRPLES